MTKLFEQLQQHFSVSDFSQPQGNQAFVSISREQAVPLLTHLRDIHGFTHLVLITCVDWLEQSRFQLTYILHNHNSHSDLGVKVFIERDNPVMDSMHHLWEQVRVYQRELHEMFGIVFPGSPGLEEPMILESWTGPPPMRRDFDTLKYSQETYCHRPRDEHQPEEHMKQKLYPED